MRMFIGSSGRLARPRSWLSGLAVGAVVAVIGAIAPTARAVVVVSDSQFAPANWSQEIIFNEGGNWTSTPTQSSTGGNPDAFRRVDLAIPVPVGNPEYTLQVFEGFSGTPYNPAVSGGVSSLSYQYDNTAVRTVDASSPHGAVSAAVFLNPALKQGDSIYSIPFNYLSNTTTWSTASLPNKASSDFVRQTGTGPANPDFSGSGAPMTLGYEIWTRFNDWSMFEGVDNFSVSVAQQVPEPATLSSIAASALLMRRRRR